MNKKNMWIFSTVLVCAGAWAQTDAARQAGSATYNAPSSTNGTTSSGLTKGTMSGGSGNDENAAGANSTMGTSGSANPVQHMGRTMQRNNKGPARESADTAGTHNAEAAGSASGSPNMTSGAKGSSGTGTSGR